MTISFLSDLRSRDNIPQGFPGFLVEQLSFFQDGAGDGQKTVTHGADGSAVTMTFLPKRFVSGPAHRIGASAGWPGAVILGESGPRSA